MKFVLFFTALLLTFPSLAKHPFAASMQEGDIIFQQSQSGQSEALREITGSVWTHVGVIVRHQGQFYVAEASRRVELTRLHDFIERGVGRRYVIKRVRPDLLAMNGAQRARLRSTLRSFDGKGYDVWFQWSDDVIYCSELVWKAFDRAFGLELSRPERFRDFPLNGPEAARLIRERYSNTGREFNLNELVVSPVALLRSELLVDVERAD